MPHVFDKYKDTPLWRAVAAAVEELQATREIAVSTAPDYVVGYLCERLVAARLAAETALTYDP
jgi:hypothetical protein